MGEAFLEEAATCSRDEAVGGGRETEEESWVLAGRPDLRARRVMAGPTGLCGGSDSSSWAPGPCPLQEAALQVLFAPSIPAPPCCAQDGAVGPGPGCPQGCGLALARRQVCAWSSCECDVHVGRRPGALHSPFTSVGSGSGPRILWSPGSHKEIRGAGGAPGGPHWNGQMAHTSVGAGLGAEGV